MKGMNRAFPGDIEMWFGPFAKEMQMFGKGGEGLIPWVDDSAAYSKLVPIGSKKASVKTIGGRSVVENQLAFEVPASSGTNREVTYTRNSDGSWNVSGTATGGKSIYNIGYPFSDVDKRFDTTHKYFLYSGESGGSTSTYYLSVAGNGSTYNNIFTAVQAGTNRPGIRIDVSEGVTINKTFRPALVDLSERFGIGSEPSSVDDPKMEEVYAYLEAHPEYNAGSIKSADVNEIESRSEDDEVIGSIEIPQALRTAYPLRSAGTAYDSYLFDTQRYEKKTAETTIGLINFTANGQYGEVTEFISADISDRARNSNVICEGFTKHESGNYAQMEFVPRTNSGKITFYANASDYPNNPTGAAKFRNDFADTKIYYELATPVETDISNLIPDGFLSNMPVEGGGSIIFKQSDSELAVPSDVEFRIKLDEAEQYIQDQYNNDLGGILG